MKFSIPSLAGLTVLALVSCENPADATTDAKVGEAQDVASSTAEAVTYQFTENSTVTFIGSKVTGSKSGGFKKVAGSFDLVDDQPVSGSFTIDMTSIYSENDKLTAHLMNEDFFNVPQFPVATFEVTEFGALEGAVLPVSGNLTMVGVTKNITFPATVTKESEGVKLHSKFDIKRHDWGIVYKGKPDDLIRNEVVIEFNLEAKQK